MNKINFNNTQIEIVNMNSSFDCEENSASSIQKEQEKSLSPNVKRRYNPVLKKIASKSITYSKRDFECCQKEQELKTNKGVNDNTSYQSETETSNQIVNSNQHSLPSQNQNLIAKFAFKRRKSTVMELPDGKVADIPTLNIFSLLSYLLLFIIHF